MKCNKCGQDIETNSKFCSNCGEAISIKKEYFNDDLKIESKKFEFNEKSKLTWYGYTTTEVICKEEEVNIRKIKTLFLSKEKMNKDIKYSDIKSLEYRTNLSIVYSGLGALAIVLAVSFSSLYLILLGALLLFLSFERILYINNKEIKIKDSSIKNNKFTEFISIIEKRANITAQVSSKKQNIISSIIKVVLGLVIMASFYGAIALLTDGVKGKEYIDIVKNGSFDNYPNVEIGEAFEIYFDNPKWRYFVSDKDIDVVEFTGKCMYDNAEVTALIQFTIDNNSRFEAKYFSMNDVSQNLLMLYGLIDVVMEDSNTNEILDSSYNNIDEEIVNKESEVLEDIEDIEDNYGYYKPNDLGEKYVTYMSENLAHDDIETIKETVLEMFFMNCSNTIGDSLNNYLEDIQFSDYQTEKGTTITIKGYSDKVGNDLMVSILATYEGDVYLTEIRQGKNNTMMDISTQLKIADDIFE